MIKAEILKLTNTFNDFSNIARVSFARATYDYTEVQNKKLNGFLKDNTHWTPFGHNRIIVRSFDHSLIDDVPYLPLELRASLIIDRDNTVSNSVWGWYELLKNWDFVGYGSAGGTRGAVIAVLDELHRYGLALDTHNGDRHKNKLITEYHPLHSGISFTCSTPIFVARQLAKHQVGFCLNEESRRYISTDPEFYFPETWRLKPDGSIKQGSGGDIHDDADLNLDYRSAVYSDLELYKYFLNELAMAPEQARMVLPQSTMTNWIWTSTLSGWKRLLNLRLDPHAQLETRRFAEQVESELKRNSYL